MQKSRNNGRKARRAVAGTVDSSVPWRVRSENVVFGTSVVTGFRSREAAEAFVRSSRRPRARLGESHVVEQRFCGHWFRADGGRSS